MPRVYSDLHHSMLRLGRVLQSTADTRYARKSELHPKDVVPGRGGADGLWQSRRFCDVGERSALPPTAIISCTAANRRDVPGPDLSALPLIQNADSIILKNSIIGACQSWRKHSGRSNMRPIILAMAFTMALPVAAFAQSDEDLRNAGKNLSEILTYGMSYNQQRFSPLNQINRQTV